MIVNNPSLIFRLPVRKNLNLLRFKREKELIAAYHQCQDSLTKIRYQAVPLYGIGYKVKDIETITGCSRVSLMEWCRAYQQYADVIIPHGGRNIKGIQMVVAQIERMLESTEGNGDWY